MVKRAHTIGQNFVVIDELGEELGPIDQETLEEWATEGHMTPENLVVDVSTGLAIPAGQHRLLVKIFDPAPSIEELITDDIPYLEKESIATFSLPPGRHWMAIAIILSLVPGLGAIYNKQPGKGLLIFGISALFAYLTNGMTLLLSYPLAMLDAAYVALRLSRGEEITEWLWF